MWPQRSSDPLDWRPPAKAAARHYVQDPGHTIPGIRLDDEVYGQAIQRLIKACAAGVLVRVRKDWRGRWRGELVLTRRRIEPAKDLQWVIGGARPPGSDAREGARRNFERETGLLPDTERLHYICTQEHQWSRRDLPPQEVGCHDIAEKFVLALTPAEEASLRLDSHEYHGDGFRAFTREQLIAERVDPSLIDLYDLIFPRKVPVWTRIWWSLFRANDISGYIREVAA